MRYVVTTVGLALTLLGFWVGGFDFNERGFTAGFIYLFSIGVSLAIYKYPGWSE